MGPPCGSRPASVRARGGTRNYGRLFLGASSLWTIFWSFGGGTRSCRATVPRTLGACPRASPISPRCASAGPPGGSWRPPTRRRSSRPCGRRTPPATPLLILAGGSNLVVADAGFPGTVLRIATRGVRADGDRLTVAAGEPWDPFVARCVAGGPRRASSASRASRARSARRRSRTSAPTARRSRRRSCPSARTTARRRAVVELPRRRRAASPTARARSSARPGAGSCSR